MAASSSSGPDPDEMFARALQLQEDERMAAELAAEERRQPVLPTPSNAPNFGMVPSDRLKSPAHKQVQQLGRATAKRIQTDFAIGPSVGALLRRGFRLFVSGTKMNYSIAETCPLLRRLVADPASRARVLELVDAGQRSRVDAQLSVLAQELPWDR